MNFTGKNILFISVCFFGYEKAICNKLVQLGARVDFYDDRPSNNIWIKALIRLNRNLLKYFIDRYYKNILKQIKSNTYDYFLVIKGEAIPITFIEKVRKLNPNIIIIGYNFDSIEEHPYFKKLMPYFDRVSTFDKADAENLEIDFKPLFCIDDYYQTSKNINPSLDLVFIGSTHTDRAVVGRKIKTIVDKLNLKCFFHYYAHSRWSFILRKYFDAHYCNFRLKDVAFRSFSHKEMIEYYQNTKAVLDINKPYQNGLTMRTFEVLVLGRKLITTNANIKDYPFYNEQNILIIDRENPHLNKEFLRTPFVPIDEKIRYEMSLDVWLKNLFAETDGKKYLCKEGQNN